MQNKLTYKTPELLDFELACGVDAETFLFSRKPDYVDLMDVFIWIYCEESKDIECLMNVIKLNRTSYYASKKRFEYRYANYADYRKLADKLKDKVKQPF